MARNYRYISADSHFESPPEQWIHRVPKQYRERAPRRIKLANGYDGLQLEGQRMMYGGTSLYGGKSPETFDPTIMDYDTTPGCGSADKGCASRIKTALTRKYCSHSMSAIKTSGTKWQ